VARYVLVAFEDNNDADNFIRGTDSGAESMRVVGVFFKPTLFCECPQIGRPSRGKRYGMNVHSCGKPIAGQWQHPRNLAKDDDRTVYEQGLYLGIVEPQDGPMPTIDFRARGKALGVTR
jgi:hypothetical protein